MLFSVQHKVSSSVWVYMVLSQPWVSYSGVVSHSDATIYLMLLNLMVYWNHCNVTKIRILEQSKTANKFFLVFTFFSFFYKQQESFCCWSTSKNLEKLLLWIFVTCASQLKMTYLITLQQVNWKRFKKFKTRSGGKEKTNCLCRERQAINSKVCDNLWSNSSYQKIPTKVPKLNWKYRTSIGKKSQKIDTGAE